MGAQQMWNSKYGIVFESMVVKTVDTDQNQK